MAIRLLALLLLAGCGDLGYDENPVPYIHLGHEWCKPHGGLNRFNVRAWTKGSSPHARVSATCNDGAWISKEMKPL